MNKIYLVTLRIYEKAETILEAYSSEEKAEKRIEELNNYFGDSPTRYLPASRLLKVNLIED